MAMEGDSGGIARAGMGLGKAGTSSAGENLREIGGEGKFPATSLQLIISETLKSIMPFSCSMIEMIVASVLAGSVGALLRIWLEGERTWLFSIVTGAIGGILFWWVLLPAEYLPAMAFGGIFGYVINDVCSSLRIIVGSR